MRVLVTGSAGKVGRAAVSALAAAGHKVVPTDLGAPRYGITGMAPYVRADLTDYGQAAGVVQAARPEVAALVRRSDVTAVSIRPTLVLTAAECREFQPRVAADLRTGSFNQWSYVDTEDLGDLVALAAAADTPGHEIVYAAQPDNLTGRPLADALADFYGDTAPPLRALGRPDGSAISAAKAAAMFGWTPKRLWRDHVT